MMSTPVTLPPLDRSFAAWLETQPTLHQLVRLAMLKVRHGVQSGRTRGELVDGRDAAHSIRCVADQGGFAEVAACYYLVYEWFCLRLIAL